MQFRIYKDVIFNNECLVFYFFAYDKLVRGKYMISVSEREVDSAFSNYLDLKEKISQKYGDFDYDTVVATVDDKEIGEDLLEEIKKGKLRFISIWYTYNSDILLLYEIDFIILQYRSRELNELEDMAKDDYYNDRL